MWKYCNNSRWMLTRSINTWNDICKLVSLFGWRTTHSRFSWNTCYHQKLQTSQLSWFIQICNSHSTFSIFKVVFSWSVSLNLRWWIAKIHWMGDRFELDVKSSIKNSVFIDVTNARPRFLHSIELIGCIAYLWLGHFTDIGRWQNLTRVAVPLKYDIQ